MKPYTKPLVVKLPPLPSSHPMHLSNTAAMRRNFLAARLELRHDPQTLGREAGVIIAPGTAQFSIETDAAYRNRY